MARNIIIYTVSLVCVLTLLYLAGVFITLDWAWVDVLNWGKGDRAFFLFVFILPATLASSGVIIFGKT